MASDGWYRPGPTATWEGVCEVVTGVDGVQRYRKWTRLASEGGQPLHDFHSFIRGADGLDHHVRMHHWVSIATDISDGL